MERSLKKIAVFFGGGLFRRSSRWMGAFYSGSHLDTPLHVCGTPFRFLFFVVCCGLLTINLVVTCTVFHLP